MRTSNRLIKALPLFLLFSASSALTSCNKGIPTYNLHTKLQQEYLESEDHSIINVEGKDDLDKQEPVKITINDNNNHNDYKIYYSYEHDYNDPLIEQDDYVTSRDKNFELNNLEFNTKYYYKVVASDNVVVQNGTFKTEDSILHNYDVEGLKNFRDMGGYETELGYFKTHMIYRCSELNHNEESLGPDDATITEKGADFLINKLHIKSEIDLRMLTEDIPEKYQTASILNDYGGSVNLFQLDLNYSGIHILSESRNDKIKQFFEIISDESNYPLLFHCHIGTDRTGMFAAAIHSLLGGSLDHIYRDYMFSNFAYIGGPRKEKGLNDSYINEFKGAPGNCVSDKAYNLLKDGVGVPASQLIKIRSILLQ